ncbi:hypothetical protein [Paenibacillus alkalitolerans]|uniref:hypothetical protein n=1 Tax=Paenibacillus alkalitolerans TaxID=2799335 RepID=UPI0018F66FC5|nr:hypothetical protein [Paenibacillus alkalitolerans]
MFPRWQCTTGNTFAYRLFKKHHTEINNLYWSHMLAANRTLNIVKKADKGMKPTTVFSASKKYMKRLPATLQQWEHDFKDFNNWVRLSAAMAINGYMEIYLRKICALAIESNPGIIIGAPGAIDGLALLKSRPSHDYSEYAVHLTKGDWNSRIGFYEKLFGEAPGKLKDYSKELNELRKMRNGVGHSFGRAMEDYDTGLHLQIKPMMRLSEERFLNWLRMADEVTLAIDNHLKDTHIGNYELLLYYHTWDGDNDGDADDESEVLQERLSHEAGTTLERRFLQEMIEYYREL